MKIKANFTPITFGQWNNKITHVQNTCNQENIKYPKIKPEHYSANYVISMRGVQKARKLSENETRFIALRDEFSQKLEPKRIQAEIACFNFDTNSTDENQKKYTRALDEYYRLFQDKETYESLKNIEKAGLNNKHLKTQLKTLLKGFDDELNAGGQMKAIRDKESEISTKYNSYTPQIDGENVSLAEIRKILQEDKDIKRREKAYSAMIKGGDIIADDIVELVKMRNEFAKSKGYNNFFEYTLKETYDVDAKELQKLLDEVYEQAKDTNEKILKKSKKELAKAFNISPKDLKAYHFRLLPENTPESLVNKSLKTKEQVVDISIQAYKNMGYDIDNMPIILDLFPRENKNTHCFGYEIDAGKDARILANLTNNSDSIGSFCHELGHCVYLLGIDENLPYLDKSTHAALTEAVAMMMEDLQHKENILKDVVSDETLDKFKKDSVNKEARFVNRSLEIINFEKSMYENPDQNLGKLWHDMRCKYMGANESEEPDNEWATVPHFISYPGYYQNYFRADIMKAQMYNHLTKTLGNITENKNTAEYLRNNLFKYGTCLSEDQLIELFTKEPLTTKYLCENLK